MFAEQVLPGRAVPDYVEFLEDFPMTPTNKVRKSELRARELSTATARRMRLLDQGRRSGPEPVF
jgi:acyl-coenzyme A synthetase/AMP-(fatty) acid ligase